jgi:hypothetical protein
VGVAEISKSTHLKGCPHTFVYVVYLCFLVSLPAEEDIVSMADSTITIDHIEGELFRIERIRDVLVRRESELRYM